MKSTMLRVSLTLIRKLASMEAVIGSLLCTLLKKAFAIVNVQHL